MTARPLADRADHARIQRESQQTRAPTTIKAQTEQTPFDLGFAAE